MNIILPREQRHSAIAACAVNLSPIHRDPFDRIIIATAIEYQGKLASIDGVFREYPELGKLLMIECDRGSGSAIAR